MNPTGASSQISGPQSPSDGGTTASVVIGIILEKKNPAKKNKSQSKQKIRKNA